MPEDVRPFLLPEEGWIQSDHPEIAGKAQQLVSGVARQAEAVDAIVAWVRGHLEYQSGLPSDAVSVFNNRAGVCSGFSTLTAALLRAAGIPARYHLGCVSQWGDSGWGWNVGEGGGWHAWNEVYYPDVGWVALDPQVTTNYLDTGHILAGFDQCGEEGTVISLTTDYSDDGYVHDLGTPYSMSTWSSLWVATVPEWDRDPLSVTPTAPLIMVSLAEPTGDFSIQVQSLSCGEDWQIRQTIPWLSPTLATGVGLGVVRYQVDATGLEPGTYGTQLRVYPTSDYYVQPGAHWRGIWVILWVVDELHRLHLPIVSAVAR